MRPDLVRPDARAALLAVALALGGCAGPALDPRPVALGPIDVFAAEVEPVLEARCAQGGCHGRGDRPFVLFAPGAHRLDPARLHLAEPLDLQEVEINARRLAVLAEARDPDRSLALRKPLALAAGGLHHGGGDVFVDRTDPGYRSIRRWLIACAPPAGGI